MEEKFLTVAIIGEPNVGKSTLVNALTMFNVSVVTRKAQTTRSIVRGIISEDECQIVFVDTPGVFQANSELDRFMVGNAWVGARDADVILVVFDAKKGISANFKDLFSERLSKKRQSKYAVVVNKIDIIEKSYLLPLISSLNQNTSIEDIFLVSAKKGSGINDLRTWLKKQAYPSSWLYGEDQVTDLSVRKMAEEITRGKILENIHDEIPYEVTVSTESWEEKRSNEVVIKQIITVSKSSHVGIVLGKGGRSIKAIRIMSSQVIQEILGKPLHLFLRVKLDPDSLKRQASSINSF